MAMWYNQRTKQYEYGQRVFRDMIPQDEASLKLYDGMLSIGKTNQEAAKIVRDAAELKSRTEFRAALEAVEQAMTPAERELRDRLGKMLE